MTLHFIFLQISKYFQQFQDAAFSLVPTSTSNLPSSCFFYLSSIFPSTILEISKMVRSLETQWDVYLLILQPLILSSVVIL